MENTEQIVATGPKLKYAGFGKRYAAYIIDCTIITFLMSPVYWEIHRTIMRYKAYLPKRRNVLNKYFNSGSSYDGLYGNDSFSNVEIYTNLYFAVIIIIFAWCYFAGMESSPWRATIGKKLLGLEVTDEDGERISFLKATGRHFGKILSRLVLWMGYISMLFSVQRQTWHDAMAGCLVREK